MTYTYTVSFPVKDDENVKLEVKYISDGNISSTVANTPGENDPEIQDEGELLLGKGAVLQTGITYVTTAMENHFAPEDTIIVEYSLNGKLVATHTNPKSACEDPIIELHLNFPKK